jgi:hypothetical protein
MSLILWDSYRAAGIPALKFLFLLFLGVFLLYVQLPLSLDQVVLVSMLPTSTLGGIPIVSCKFYPNTFTDKVQILKDNKKKSGVYF